MSPFNAPYKIIASSEFTSVVSLQVRSNKQRSNKQYIKTADTAVKELTDTEYKTYKHIPDVCLLNKSET